MANGLWGPRKALDADAGYETDRKLRKTLSWPHLIALGIGAIVGTGIYTLTGVGADRAGPAVILSFAIAGAVCACAALAYAELATLIPATQIPQYPNQSLLGNIFGILAVA